MKEELKSYQAIYISKVQLDSISNRFAYLIYLLFYQFITPELLERCNTGTTAQKLTNDLLRGLYERECLASHSISGVVYNKRGQPKPALPTEEVQAILSKILPFNFKDC